MYDFNDNKKSVNNSWLYNNWTSFWNCYIINLA